MNETPRTDVIKEPCVVTRLRDAQALCAVEGIVSIVWPENHHIIDYIEVLKYHVHKLERELGEAITLKDDAMKHLQPVLDNNDRLASLLEAKEIELTEANNKIAQYEMDTGLDAACKVLLMKCDRWKAMAQELAQRLKKYQARYHGAAHTQKDWNESDKTLSRFNELNL